MIQPILANPTPHIPHQNWSFQGFLGHFDLASLQRGFQVYKEVCSACHSLKRISFRHLEALGFSKAEIKALSATYQIKDISSETGEPIDRPGLPSDFFPLVYPNETAARAANNGASPTDLSLIVKARINGPDYIYALLTGYQKPPADIKIDATHFYNTAFPGHIIAMQPPLTADGQLTYADKTPSTITQMAHDVTTFLAWTSEPEMMDRKQTGLKVLMYLFVMTILLYMAKRRIWSRLA